MSEQQENILSRVKKLREITVERGASESEANSAAELASDLLIKHNISLMDIDSDDAQQKMSEEKNLHRSGKLAGWKVALMTIIADHYFCQAIVISHSRGRKKIGKSFTIIGKPMNVAVTNEMYQYLAETIHALSWKALDEERAIIGGKVEYGRAFAEAWRQGCVLRIDERLREKRAQMEKNGLQTSEVQTTALVVKSLYDKELALIEDFLKASGVKLKDYKFSGIRDVEAYNRGYDKGNEVGLDGQLQNGEEEKKKPLLLN